MEALYNIEKSKSDQQREFGARLFIQQHEPMPIYTITLNFSKEPLSSLDLLLSHPLLVSTNLVLVDPLSTLKFKDAIEHKGWVKISTCFF